MKTQATTHTTRNPMAGLLAHGSNRHQVVRAKKGKGSFSRQAKHRARDFN